MVLPRFHPFPVGPRPPSVTSVSLLFHSSPFHSCDLPIPAHSNPPRAKACIPPFVCFGIYRASRFFLEQKTRSNPFPPKPFPVFDCGDRREECSSEISSRIAAGNVLIGIHRNMWYTCREYRELRFRANAEGGIVRKRITRHPRD